MLGPRGHWVGGTIVYLVFVVLTFDFGLWITGFFPYCDEFALFGTCIGSVGDFSRRVLDFIGGDCALEVLSLLLAFIFNASATVFSSTTIMSSESQSLDEGLSPSSRIRFSSSFFDLHDVIYISKFTVQSRQ